jgi:hypothetical protein
MASVAARTQSRRTTRTSPHRAAATMMPIGLTALQRRPRVPDEMDPASRVGPQHALISALYTRTKPAYMYMGPPRAGGDGAERRARRPRRAPAGPAARAGYTGHQPPLQRARQRADARGGRLLSPGTVPAALAMHSAQAASNDYRTERIRPAAVSSRRPSTWHEQHENGGSTSRPLAGPSGLCGANTPARTGRIRQSPSKQQETLAPGVINFKQIFVQAYMRS